MSNTEPTPLGPSIDLGFITAALAVFTFTLHVILRRGAELVGYAPNLGVCLALAGVAVTVMVGLSAGRGQRWAVIGIALSFTGVAAGAAVGFRQLPDAGWDAQMYHLPSVLRTLERMDADDSGDRSECDQTSIRAERGQSSPGSMPSLALKAAERSARS